MRLRRLPGFMQAIRMEKRGRIRTCVTHTRQSGSRSNPDPNADLQPQTSDPNAARLPIRTRPTPTPDPNAAHSDFRACAARSDSRPPTSEPARPAPTSDLRPPTSDLRPSTSDFRLPSLRGPLRLPTSDFRLPTSDSQPQPQPQPQPQNNQQPIRQLVEYSIE
jgi:hypothetical protein